MNLGAHMSIAGGVETALKRGISIGCNAVQLFTKNNNRWTGKPIGGPEAERFHTLAGEFAPGFLVSHAAYLINLCSPKTDVLEKSIPAFRDELERAELLDLVGVVFHPGSHLGEGEEWGIDRIAQSLDQVHSETRGLRALSILENTAGQGSNLGYTLEQLAAIRERVANPERIGVCFDTCHAFTAGYPIHTRKGYLETVRRLDKILGLACLKVIHLNDSKKEFGSRRDRHEHIGQGEIGEDAFGFFVNERRFRKIPMILETPKSEDMHEDVTNLKLLRSFRK